MFVNPRSARTAESDGVGLAPYTSSTVQAGEWLNSPWCRSIVSSMDATISSGRSVGPTENVVTPRSREWTPPDSRHTTWAAALFSAVSVIHTWRRAASPTNLSPKVGSTTIATPWVVSFRAISVFTVLSLTLIPACLDILFERTSRPSSHTRPAGVVLVWLLVGVPRDVFLADAAHLLFPRDNVGLGGD